MTTSQNSHTGPQGPYPSLVPPHGPPAIPPQAGPMGGFPSYPTGPGPVPPARNGFGTTALVLGIVGLIFALIPIIGVIAWPLVILGLVFGVLGILRVRAGAADNQGTAVSGTVLSALGLIICILWAAWFGSVASSTQAPSSSTPGGATSRPVPSAAPNRDQPVASGFPGATINDVTGRPGDTLTVDDMQITATPLRPGDSTLGATLCTTVTYRNLGSTPGSFNGAFDWKLQDPSGAALMTGFTGSDNMLRSGDLTPGGTTTGDMCFDRTSSARGQYVLLYDPMDFTAARGAWLNPVG